MASTWGSTDIKILYGSMRADALPDSIVEILLAPDPANLSAISSVIQQQGRRRKTQKGKFYFSSLTDYQSLLNDQISGMVRTITDDVSGVSGSYVIQSMGEAEVVQDNVFIADVTFMEATP